MPPEPPTDVHTLVVNEDDVTIAWNPSTSTHESQRVYYSRDYGQTYVQFDSGLSPSTSQYQFTDLLDGELYLFTVGAVDSSGEVAREDEGGDVTLPGGDATGSLGLASFGEASYGTN